VDYYDAAMAEHTKKVQSELDGQQALTILKLLERRTAYWIAAFNPDDGTWTVAAGRRESRFARTVNGTGRDLIDALAQVATTLGLEDG
jgi:hypothetical protein